MAPPSMAGAMPLRGAIMPQDSSVTHIGAEKKRNAAFIAAAASMLKATSNNPNEALMKAPSNNPNEALMATKPKEKRIISYDEVAKHRSEDDAWIVVDGKVYDVTPFLETHPGGHELILDHLHSRDVGNLMRGKEEEDGHSHSKAAFKMLQQFLIGSVENYVGPKGNESMNKGDLKKQKYTVDLTKPIVPQVGYLGADYDDWVHDPIVSKESPRFFKSNISEFFTRTHWSAIPLIWMPISIYMQYLAVKNGVSLADLPVLIIAGLMAWTFLEYMLHRFLFHMKTSSFWGNTFHYVIHGFHHKHPMDAPRLVFPPAFSSVICIIIWILLGSWFAPYPKKLSIYSGALMGYVAYDLTHYYLHFGAAFSDHSRKMKRYHLNHHFKDQTNGYGITSTIWDFIFRTLPTANFSED